MLFNATLLAGEPSGNHPTKKSFGTSSALRVVHQTASTTPRRSSWQAPQKIPRSVWPRSPPRSGAFPARGARPCPRVGRAEPRQHGPRHRLRHRNLRLHQRRVGQAEEPGGRARGPRDDVVGSNTFTPGLLFPELDPAKSYWVVAKGFCAIPQWSTAGNSGVISPVSQQSMKTAFTSPAGSNWTTAAASGNPSMMTVNAVAVPAPSTWAMGLAGLGFAGVKALRRRRRQG